MSPDDKQQNRSRIILAVDDAPENLNVLKAFLSAQGYTFFGVTNGPESLQFVLRVQPRLILLDIVMPELDGFETCRRLRAIHELDEVPIIFLTTQKTRDDVRAGMQAGGNDFVIKPFEYGHLLKRIEHWMARRAPARGGA